MKETIKKRILGITRGFLILLCFVSADPNPALPAPEEQQDIQNPGEKIDAVEKNSYEELQSVTGILGTAPNIAIQSVIASENQTKWHEGHLINNDYGAFWRSATRGSYIKLDLGSIRCVKYVEIMFWNKIDTYHDEFQGKNYENHAYQFDIQFSANDAAYYSMLGTSGQSDPNNPDYQRYNAFAQANARYIKIIFYGSNRDTEACVDEVRVYGHKVNAKGIYDPDSPNHSEDQPSESLPNKPANLSAQGSSTNSISLNWSDTSNNERGFEILRSDDGGATFTKRFKIKANITSYRDTGLGTAATYFYKIRAYNYKGVSGYTNIIAATTYDASGNPIPAPLILDEDTNDSRGSVSFSGSYNYWQTDIRPGAYNGDCKTSVYSWEGSYTSGNATYRPIFPRAGKYNVYIIYGYREYNKSSVRININASGNSGSRTLDMSNQSTCGKWNHLGTYFFNSGQSGTVVINGTQDSGIVADAVRFDYIIPVPSTPTGLSAAPAAYNKINLSWSDNADNETGYKIFRKKNGETEYTEIASTGANARSYQDINLTYLTTYTYRVQAYNGDYVSGFSNEAAATTFDRPPVPPSDLTTDLITETTITISWKDNSRNELGFEIWRKKDGQKDFTQTGVTGENTTSYFDTGLDIYTGYSYKVCSFNKGGISGFSNMTSEVTLRPITTLDPTADVEWAQGRRYTVRWEKLPTVRAVNLDLLHNGTVLGRIAGDLTGNSHTFRIPVSLEIAPGYAVKITSVENQIYCDTSPLFAISKGKKQFYITQPDKNTYWEIKHMQDITWELKGAADPAATGNIYLYNEDTYSETAIGSSLLQDKAFRFQILPEIPAGKNYRIYIDTEGQNITYSDRIEIGDPFIAVTYPDATTDWNQNAIQKIEYKKSNSINGLSLELWKGQNFVKKIVNQTQNANSYTFTMSNDLEPGSDYMIVAFDTNDPLLFARSSAFTINAPRPDFASIACDLTLPDNGQEHWISNIPGDRLTIEKVTITARNPANQPVTLRKYFTNVQILPPIDPYWQTNNAGTNNINRNKGRTDYGFYAFDTTNDRVFHLATFYQDGDETNDRFKITYNTAYYDADNKLLNGYYLRAIPENGTLCFYNEALDLTTDTFAVGVLDNTGVIRPGDDMQLRFGLSDYPEYHATVGEGDFMAVYDKKMLWRANLYIDERYNTDGTPVFLRTQDANGTVILPDETEIEYQQRLGQLDWNNRNPWVTGNQWNTPPQGYNGVAGGQVLTIKKWTNFQTHIEVHNTVAYGWGCWDGVSDFNNELTAQSTAISNKRATNTTYAALQWENNSTLAPGGDWDNYLFPARKITQLTDATYDYYEYRYSCTQAQINGATQHDYYTNGSNASIPGFSTFLRFCTSNTRNNILDAGNSGSRNYNWTHNGRTAGIDCSGLVHRSAIYNGNPYTLPVRNHEKKRTADLVEDTESWLISNVRINRVVPGDIIIRQGHVAIIKKVTYQENSRTLPTNVNGLFDTVELIEAAQGRFSEWRVINTNTWANLGNTYSARRLRTNN